MKSIPSTPILSFFSKPFVTLNPSMFATLDTWNFRHIQNLCMQLKLGGKGTRDDLVRRLMAWHTRKNNGTAADSPTESEESEEEDTLESSICSEKSVGSSESYDFTKSQDENEVSISTTEDDAGMDGDDEHEEDDMSMVLSKKIFMGPLRTRNNLDVLGAPTHSILRVHSAYSPNAAPAHAKRLKFSPFNGCRFIPSRRAQVTMEMSCIDSDSSDSSDYEE